VSIDPRRSLDFVELFIAVKRAVSLAGWRALSGLKLGPGQVQLMRFVARSKPTAQGELARGTGMDPSAASRAVNSLIALGYLRRQRGEVDRREAVIHLTPAGRRASARIDRVWQQMALALTRDLDGRDLAAFEQVAAKLLPLGQEPAAPRAKGMPRRRAGASRATKRSRGR
jgi:DNA-binding MarR family transcriptional regulator